MRIHLFKKKKGPDIGKIIDERLEAYDKKKSSSNSKEDELERKRAYWNSLPPRVKVAWLRKEGINGKKVLIRLGILQEDAPDKKQ